MNIDKRFDEKFYIRENGLWALDEEHREWIPDANDIKQFIKAELKTLVDAVVGEEDKWVEITGEESEDELLEKKRQDLVIAGIRHKRTQVIQAIKDKGFGELIKE